MKKLIAAAAIALLAATGTAIAKEEPKKPAATTAAAPAKAEALLDLNTASRDELIKLKGRRRRARRRDHQGRPYKAKNELVDRKIVPRASTTTSGQGDRQAARRQAGGRQEEEEGRLLTASRGQHLPRMPARRLARHLHFRIRGVTAPRRTAGSSGPS